MSSSPLNIRVDNKFKRFYICPSKAEIRGEQHYRTLAIVAPLDLVKDPEKTHSRMTNAGFLRRHRKRAEQICDLHRTIVSAGIPFIPAIQYIENSWDNYFFPMDGTSARFNLYMTTQNHMSLQNVHRLIMTSDMPFKAEIALTESDWQQDDDPIDYDDEEEPIYEENKDVLVHLPLNGLRTGQARERISRLSNFIIGSRLGDFT